MTLAAFPRPFATVAPLAQSVRVVRSFRRAARHAAIMLGGPPFAQLRPVQRPVIAAAQHLQVLQSIIVALAVDMVDVLARVKRSAQMALHHQPVLQDVALSAGAGVIASKDVDIAALLVPTSSMGALMSAQQCGGLTAYLAARSTSLTCDRRRLTTATVANSHKLQAWVRIWAHSEPPALSAMPRAGATAPGLQRVNYTIGGSVENAAGEQYDRSLLDGVFGPWVQRKG